MADEFQTGVCSSNWWNSSRNGFTGSSSPCSTGISEMGSFGWVHGSSEMGRSCEESASISGNSGSFQDAHKSQASDSVAGDGTVLMDSTLQMVGFDLSSPTMDWNHALLRSSGRAESNFQSLLQEELSSRSNFHQESPMETTHVQKEWNPKSFSSGSEDSMNTFKQINQGFGFDQQRMNSSSGECIVTCQGLASSNFSMGLASYGCPSTLDQGLIDHDPQSQQTSYENRTIDYSSQINYRLNSNDFSSTWPRYPQFVKTSSPQKQAPNNQLQFSNNTHFWNAMAGAANDATSSFYPPSHTQFPPQSYEERPNSSSTLPAAKTNAEGIRDSCSVTKKSSSEPTFKRPRMETPSPLPTFKVRKEKLGDRITALQQLVSPFGKTDTASVLFEAIDYIKFLHEQVSLLSTPYMKNGAPIQHQQNSEKSKDGEGTGQDLRSRGLCLVPISSTFPVTNETTADFWTPTFGGTFR